MVPQEHCIHQIFSYRQEGMEIGVIMIKEPGTFFPYFSAFLSKSCKYARHP
jgi:hypothetical protein